MPNWDLSSARLFFTSGIIDTLALAKKRHPMGPNSLDALCKRYGIDTAKRTKHWGSAGLGTACKRLS